MPKSVVKTFKVTRETNRRLQTAAKARRVTEAELIREGIARTLQEDGIDMVAALSGDFGCVRSGDSRTVRQKLASFGRHAGTR